MTDVTSTHKFKPSHKSVKDYYAELEGYREHDVEHETAIRSAFQNLLSTTAKKHGWHLVPEQTTKVKGKSIRPDGTLRDSFNLHRGQTELLGTILHTISNSVPSVLIPMVANT